MGDVRIPIEKHPYASVEQSIQLRDERLALVHNARRGEWMIVQSSDGWPVRTHPALYGIPGIEENWCPWFWIMSIHDRAGTALEPDHASARILWALDRMDTYRAGGLTAYLDMIDNEGEEVREKALRDAKDDLMQRAKEMSRNARSIISTPHGTINVAKMYEQWDPRGDKMPKREPVKIYVP